MRLSTKSKLSIKAHVDIYFREYLFLKDMENLNQILRKSFSTPNFTVIAIHASRELMFFTLCDKQLFFENTYLPLVLYATLFDESSVSRYYLYRKWITFQLSTMNSSWKKICLQTKMIWPKSITLNKFSLYLGFTQSLDNTWRTQEHHHALEQLCTMKGRIRRL